MVWDFKYQSYTWMCANYYIITSQIAVKVIKKQPKMMSTFIDAVPASLLAN